MRTKILLTVLATLFLFGTNGLAQNKVNGENVHMAVFETGGKILGAFVETSDGQWTEYQSGKRYYLSENTRDEWSVYLNKPDGSIVQVDLWTKKVNYQAAGTNNWVFLYKVNSASAVANQPGANRNVKGYNVNAVFYERGSNGGVFVQTNSGTWYELNEDGAFSFTEINRDEWSVYLRKNGDGLEIQIDIFLKKVSLFNSDKGQVLDKLYSLNRVFGNS